MARKHDTPVESEQVARLLGKVLDVASVSDPSPIATGAARPRVRQPAPPRKRLAQHCEQRTIRGAELGPLDLAAQDLELVAQDRDLDVLGMLGLETPKQEAEESARDEVEEEQGRRRIMS